MSRKRRRLTKKRKKAIRRNLLVLLFICIIAILAMVIFKMISSYEQSILEEESEMNAEYDLAQNSYNPAAVHFDGSKAYYEDDRYASMQGIDVSAHNGDIDWSAVKNAGIQFAMIRCGYRGYDAGRIQDDSKFEANYEGAVENNIETGVYFFSQAASVDEAAEEADYVIDKLKNKKIDLPVVFDMEIPDSSSRVVSLTREEKTQVAVTFMNRIKDAGYEPMIYASSQQMNAVFDLRYLQNYDFWIAEYESKWPDYAYAYSMWQYSSTGSVDGISGNVDMDLLFTGKE